MPMSRGSDGCGLTAATESAWMSQLRRRQQPAATVGARHSVSSVLTQAGCGSSIFRTFWPHFAGIMKSSPGSGGQQRGSHVGYADASASKRNGRQLPPGLHRPHRHPGRARHPAGRARSGQPGTKNQATRAAGALERRIEWGGGRLRSDLVAVFAVDFALR